MSETNTPDNDGNPATRVQIDPALQRRSRIKLIGILAAFGLPLLLATFWLHHVRVSGGSLGLSARGELIHPAFRSKVLSCLKTVLQTLDSRSTKQPCAVPGPCSMHRQVRVARLARKISII